MLTEPTIVTRAIGSLLFKPKASRACVPPLTSQARFAHMPGALSVRRRNKFANDAGKAGGDISDAFASMSGGSSQELPTRYAALKNELVPNQTAQQDLVSAWRDVLQEVNSLTETIRQESGSMIPKIEYESIVEQRLSAEDVARIRTVGTVIIKNAVSKEEALRWKAQVQEYAKTNKELATGFPAENPQVWEFYHSKPQIQARTHPNVLASQDFLLRLWHASAASEVDFKTPLSYFDRLRIRFPGDAKFALGPHIDGGSVERWEDPTYRQCFSQLLGLKWREHDAFDGTHRINAIMDMYKGQGACNVFRPWQGWLSMSTTRANEGTLQVFPNIQIASAYLILRPFFKASRSLAELDGDRAAYLAAENWVLNLDGPEFPNSVPGHGQELNDETHPHLDLTHTMTSLPVVEPGDQVYWHCDVIHAVEKTNAGKGDSSVMYIPAVPLTVNNAEYLAAQRESFLVGYPPFDFSGGEGEKSFTDRATKNDVHPEVVAQRAMGFTKFEATPGGGAGQIDLVRKANEWLF